MYSAASSFPQAKAVSRSKDNTQHTESTVLRQGGDVATVEGKEREGGFMTDMTGSLRI